MLARHFAIATLGLPLRLDNPVQVCPPLVSAVTYSPSIVRSRRRGQSILSEILLSVAAKQQLTPLKAACGPTSVDNWSATAAARLCDHNPLSRQITAMCRACAHGRARGLIKSPA